MRVVAVRALATACQCVYARGGAPPLVCVCVCSDAVLDFSQLRQILAQNGQDVGSVFAYANRQFTGAICQVITRDFREVGRGSRFVSLLCGLRFAA